MIRITEDDVRTHLSAIVQEAGPDYVYERVQLESGETVCQYVDNGAPSCLVGHFLHRMGVPIESLSLGDTRLGEAALDLLERLAEHQEIEGVTLKVSRALQVAQSTQDEGMSWGQALDEALEWL